MDSLFEIWKTKIPKYSIEFNDLFELLAYKGGADSDKKLSSGKHFSNYYELYIYAFFLGLYKNELKKIPQYDQNGKRKYKIDFSHAIENWGKKNNSSNRNEFINLQEFIFAALIAKTDIDLIALEKCGESKEDSNVDKLIDTMESYTNGGLFLIKDEITQNPNFTTNPTSFFTLITKIQINS